MFALSLATVAASPWAAAASTYTVRPGDTLFAIARRYRTTVGVLERANGIGSSALIRPGEVLRLTTGGEAAAPRPRTYRVRAGDNLWTIAGRLGVSVSALEAANGLHTSLIRPGQRLVVPGTAQVQSSRPGRTAHTALPATTGRPIARATAHHRAAHLGGGTYAVRAGETLRDIATQRGVSLATLRRLNPGLKPSDLHVGTVLRLPRRLATTVGQAAEQVVSRFGDHLAVEVQRFLGVPYVWGGTSPRGFDCSGLVQYVFGQLGVSVPRDATEQYYAGTAVPRADLQAGDLVFFDTEGGISHVGIYIGNGQFVDAPTTGQFVQVDSLYNPYWEATFIGARALGPMR